MEPNVFMGYLERGISCSLSPLGHEQYTLLIAWTNIIQPMLFTKYPNEGITFFLGFVRAMYNTSPSIKIYDMEPKLFLGYPERGITCSLNILLYELEYNMH
jgi:hypothetical protein